MPNDPLAAPLPLEWLTSFLVVLTRVGFALAFVPLPGFRTAPLAPRIVLVLGLTLALTPVWPRMPLPAGATHFSFWWLGGEALLGVTIGVFVAWLHELLIMAMQFLSLQAGYGYAGMIDPATQADSGVLQVIAQLAGWLLFFAVGLDRELIRLFASSFTAFPPGEFRLDAGLAQSVIAWSGAMIKVAVRMALPLVAVLVLLDFALALLGRLQAQLQLLTLAFPAKMAVATFLLAFLTATFAALYRSSAADLVATLGRVVARP